MRLGLRTSKVHEYAPPPAKAYTGVLADFALGEPTGGADVLTVRTSLTSRSERSAR